MARGGVIGAIADILSGNLLSAGMNKIPKMPKKVGMGLNFPLQMVNYVAHERMWGDKLYTPSDDINFERERFVANATLDNYIARTEGTKEELEATGSEFDQYKILQQPKLAGLKEPRGKKQVAATKSRNRWVLDRLQKTDPRWEKSLRSEVTQNPGKEELERLQKEGTVSPLIDWRQMEPFVAPKHPDFEAEFNV